MALNIWLIFIIRTILSLIGIFLNLMIPIVTIRSKKLHSICNWLIALESFCLCLFHLSSPFTLIILLSTNGEGGIPLTMCFFVHAPSIFGVLMAFQIMLQIGIERLLKVLCPIWSRSHKSRNFHLALLFLSILSCAYLLGILFFECNDNENYKKKVLCQVTDVSSNRPQFYSIAFIRSIILHSLLLIIYSALWMVLKIKKSENSKYISRRIARSLIALAFIEIMGWLPSLFLVKITIMLQLNAEQNAIFFASYAFLTILTASVNMPFLYTLSKNYRDAFNQLLTDFGFHRGVNSQITISHPHHLAILLWPIFPQLMLDFQIQIKIIGDDRIHKIS